MNPFDLPGPQFLLFYIVFAAAVVAGLVFWRRRAELSSSSPRIDLSDPYLIAYLRGGEREVLRVATVTLIDRGLLNRNGSHIQRAENASPDSVRRPVEQALLKKYARGGEVSWMFEDDGLSKACEPYGDTLRRARLLPDESVNQARLVQIGCREFPAYRRRFYESVYCARRWTFKRWFSDRADNRVALYRLRRVRFRV